MKEHTSEEYTRKGGQEAVAVLWKDGGPKRIVFGNSNGKREKDIQKTETTTYKDKLDWA